jgi:CHAT domain-containing protein
MQGLPFAAFRSSPTSPYLVEDAIIEWQGSALLYVFSLMRDRAMPHDPSLLLIGNPEFDPTLPFAAGSESLPSAEQEVRRIYERHGKHAELRVGKEATISEFLELARHNAIVHLALHAVVNTRAPHQSALLLARASDTDRGVLEAQELLRRAKLDRTRLVILSACSTASGAPVGPEGVGPLVRPLLAAGVPSVLGTLWRVNDATAQQVLVSFHQHFQSGSDAAVALRNTQRKLLGPDTRTPLLKRAITWAPYQVIGHATSPYRASKEKEEPP